MHFANIRVNLRPFALFAFKANDDFNKIELVEIFLLNLNFFKIYYKIRWFVLILRSSYILITMLVYIIKYLPHS